MNPEAGGGEGMLGGRDEGSVGIGEFGRRRVMVTGAFIPKRPVDQDEVRRRPQWGNLSRRSDAEQQFATQGEHLFSYKHGVGSPYRAVDNADAVSVEVGLDHPRVVARPLWYQPRSPGPRKMPNDVAVRIEHADPGYIRNQDTLLAAGLADQRIWFEDGRAA